ncbi:MAG: winged helix-turn-helix transcriptional regulator [SAR324 cluster bacterium]|nr:winged helix-turn-helix transcriptional regulator [SAR324 cluster bacterium]
MDKKIKARYDEQARIIKALAHPSRLMIVEELHGGKKCVSDLTEFVGSDTSTVSKHLSVLKNAGLVLTEKQGTTVFYHLRMPCILDFFSCIESVIEANAFGQMETVISCKTK